MEEEHENTVSNTSVMETLSIEDSVFQDWGSIISQVHNSLPTIDSDSETNEPEDDFSNEIPVFQRKLLDERADSDKISLGSSISPKAWQGDEEPNETITNASEGYGSASSSSSTSTATTKDTSLITNNNLTNQQNLSTEYSVEGKVESSTLLFQRLLYCSALSGGNAKEDLHLSDLDLDLPIYGDDEATSQTSSNNLSNSPPPLDLKNSEGLKLPNQDCDSAESLPEDLDNDDKAPVLSLRALEGFDLDDILDTIKVKNKTNTLNSSSDEMSLSDDKVEELMTQLRDLSLAQQSESSRRNSPNYNDDSLNTESFNLKYFFPSNSLSEDPGGFDKEATEYMEKDLKTANKKTSSQGVSANFSSNTLLTTGLSMSEPTTVFIDLRKNNQNKNLQESITQDDENNSKPFPVKRFKRNNNTYSQQKSSQPAKTKLMNRLTRSVSSSSETSDVDDDDDDNDYEEWKRMRNRIKSRSSATATARSKSLFDESFKTEEIKSINQQDTISKVSDIVKTSNDHNNNNKNIDKTSGEYEKNRLKRDAGKVLITNSKEKLPKKNKSKATVTFAEEPKKDDDDSNNVYRSKCVTKKESKTVRSSTTTSVQTEESFNKPLPSLRDKLNDILNCQIEEDKSAANGTCLPKSDDTDESLGFLPITNNKLEDSRKISDEQIWARTQSAIVDRIATLKMPRIPRERKLEMENKLNGIREKYFSKDFYSPNILFDLDTSFDKQIASVPPTLNTSAENYDQMVVLTINLSSPGCIVTHRAGVGYRQTPVDQPNGFSITYAMLLSWLLALVPEDLKHLNDARLDGTFSLDTESYPIDPESVTEITGKDSTTYPIEIPFNVVAVKQLWQEDTQAMSLQAVVVPNEYYKPEIKGRGRKKIKKEDAFLQGVWHFLQSNRVQDVCPWHSRPESPIYYTLSETSITCASKPMSCYVSTSNDPLVLKKALHTEPGFFWKNLPSDDQSISPLSSTCNKTEVTTCLLQRDALMYPIAVMDVILRIQTSCFDLAGLRLAFVQKKFINSNTLYQNPFDKDEMNEILPCVVLAIRGRSAITKWANIVGPRDPVLARLTDRESLNATYGDQLTEKKKDKSMTTDLNMFCYPRSETRAMQQLCVWFGGRINLDAEHFAPVSENSQTNISNEDKKSKSKNGKGKSKNNSNSKNKKAKASAIDPGTQYILSCPSLLTVSATTRMYLVVSPRLPTRFFGDVLTIITSNGFVVEGIRRMRLSDRKATALAISSRYYSCYCPSLKSDMPIEADYYELDNWWTRPTTIMLLSRENAHCHQSSLLHAFQSDLMYGLATPGEETRECFHTTPHTESVEHVIGSLTKVPDIELITGESPRSFYSNPEMEQVTVLTLVGDKGVDDAGHLIRMLLHGEFRSTSAGQTISTIDSEDDLELNEPGEFRGFELLGIKWLPSLNILQTKELTPFEVGTQHWHESIPLLKSSPVVICVLRRINAFQVLKEALNIPSPSVYTETCLLLKDVQKIMSQTPEIAYRQMQMFFTDKELFADNQCRPLLKYLPSPTLVHQHKLQQGNGGSSNGFDETGSGDVSTVNNNAVSQNTPSSKSKKKKKNGKNKDTNNNQVNTNSNSNSSSQIQEESIFSSVMFCQSPLTSVLVIKPDAFPRHFVKIFRHLHQEGFSLVAAKLIRMSEDQAMELLPKHFKDMHGESQVFLDHMTSGPSLVVCVQRDNAIRHLVDLAGPYDPVAARRKQSTGSSLYALQSSLPNSSSNSTWRAIYGIDNISNGIHVSDSYNSAMQELKRFFPEGLCCEETLELNMELVPTPGEDSIMDLDKMKGREIHYLNDLDLLTTVSSTSLHCPHSPRQAVAVILDPNLFFQPRIRQQRHQGIHTYANQKTRRPLPAYLLILEQLLIQGFEVCGLRLVWFKKEQATEALKYLGIIHENVDGNQEKEMVDNLCQGSSMVLLLQRENALVLFDSILGSTQSRGDSLYHKYSEHILRSQTPSQTEKSALYLFNRVDNPKSVLQIGHKRALEWRNRPDVMSVKSFTNSMGK